MKFILIFLITFFISLLLISLFGETYIVGFFIGVINTLITLYITIKY